MVTKSKYYLFVINNYTPADESKAEDFCKSDKVEFAIYQAEVGESGTPHLQGYICLRNRTTLPALSKALPRANLQARRGTHDEAKKYSSKEETRVRGPFTFGDDSGVPSKPGQRSDLLAIREALNSGNTLADVADQYFGTFIRYHAGLRSYVSLRGPVRSVKTRVEVHHGVPGAGKSHYARSKCDDAGIGNWYWMSRPADGQAAWWDGIDPHVKVIVLDDFTGWLPFTFMLQLCDAYPFRVQVKGSSVSVAPDLLVITSNVMPELWYPRVSEDRVAALMRRLDEVVKYEKKWEDAE